MCCLSPRKGPPGCQFKSLQDTQQHPKGCILQSQQDFSLWIPPGLCFGSAALLGWSCVMCQLLKEPLASPCSHTGLLESLSGICLVELDYLEPFGCL